MILISQILPGLELDEHVDLKTLKKARYDIDMLIRSALAQLQEIRTEPGTKNVKFFLHMFIDNARLRKEKVERTIGARQLLDAKRNISNISGFSVQDFSNSGESMNKITAASAQLHRVLQSVRDCPVIDVMCRELQNALENKTI